METAALVRESELDLMSTAALTLADWRVEMRSHEAYVYMYMYIWVVAKVQYYTKDPKMDHNFDNHRFAS